MPFDTTIAPPYYQAPTADRPDLLVDQYRTLIADPDGNWIGQPGDLGGAGKLGRLVYAERTPSSRNL